MSALQIRIPHQDSQASIETRVPGRWIGYSGLWQEFLFPICSYRIEKSSRKRRKHAGKRRNICGVFRRAGAVCGFGKRLCVQWGAGGQAGKRAGVESGCHEVAQFVFGFLKHAEDKEKLAEYVEEHEDVFSDLDEQAFDMISCMSRAGELKVVKEKYQNGKGGSINMCRAITEMIADGRREGEDQFARLMQILLDEGNAAGLQRAVSNQEYRHKLYMKYQICQQKINE